MLRPGLDVKGSFLLLYKNSLWRRQEGINCGQERNLGDWGEMMVAWTSWGGNERQIGHFLKE